MPNQKELKPRPARFPIKASLRYRRVGEAEWRRASTENLSGTGALFQSESPMEPNAKLEMRLALPGKVAGQPPAVVVARGTVVRSALVGSGALGSGTAVQFSNFRLLRGGGFDF
jgi:hypothetical protein